MEDLLKSAFSSLFLSSFFFFFFFYSFFFFSLFSLFVL
jgi:hypothetical protein